MKVRGSLRRKKSDWKIVKRRGKIYVIKNK